MALTQDFDIYPRQGVCKLTTPYGLWLKCYDKTYKATSADNEPVTWLWTAGRTVPLTPDHTVDNFTLTGAPDIFPNDTQIVLAGTIPTGLAANTAYWIINASGNTFQISETKGGAVKTFTSNGANVTGQAASSLQHPVIYVTDTSENAIDVSLSVNAAAATTKSSLGRLMTTAAVKPTSETNFGRFAILVYDPPTTASPTATLINLLKTGASNLLYYDLKFTNSMNKAGTATFNVLDDGTATATEKALMDADKWIAIIGGRSVIWSGKIIRAIQSKMSLYDSATQKKIWNVECESDISKMKLQNVKAANIGTYKGTIGNLMKKLLETDGVAGSVDWRQGSTFDFDKNLLATDGPDVVYSITNEDMYTQFTKLANLVDFDWRTRNNYLRYYYATFVNATHIISTSLGTGYTADELIGDWVVFVNINNASAVRNSFGAQAFGLISDNDNSTITCAEVTNGTNPPAASDYILVIRKPVVDVAYDLTKYGTVSSPAAPGKVNLITMNKARTTALANGYEYDDKTDYKALATKVVTRGKDLFTDTNITARAAAVQPWELDTQQFTYATYITYQTDTYLHTPPSADYPSNFYVYGWNLAWKVGEVLNVIKRNDVSVAYYSWTITALQEVVFGGQKCTYVTISASVGVPVFDLVGALVTNLRLYVKDKVRVGYVSGGPTVQTLIGSEHITGASAACGTDAQYGDYLGFAAGARSITDNTVNPHFPGAIVWKYSTYSETSPATGSSLKDRGLLLKTLTVDQQTTVADLEVYASSYLIMMSRLWKKATFWCYIYDWYKTDYRNYYQLPNAVQDAVDYIRVGDEIDTTQITGDTVVSYQVVQFAFDQRAAKVTVDLGDHDKNVFTQLIDSTAAINKNIT
jgi:hypothetical protein